jgi:Cu-processing system ATP-binding protein
MKTSLNISPRQVKNSHKTLGSAEINTSTMKMFVNETRRLELKESTSLKILNDDDSDVLPDQSKVEMMIETKGVVKNFGKLRALDNISVGFHPGQTVALLGPNGSGKTTFIKSILGMVVPDEGDIVVDGESILKGFSYRSKIGYMPQIGRYPDNMSIRQVIEMMKDIRQPEGGKYDEDLIVAFQMKDLMEKKMRTLSGGTRQKVSACLAFLFNPKILILDEPTAGLDPLSSEVLKEKILSEKRKGKLILITSHILSELDDITTDIMYLMDGKIKFCKKITELMDETGEDKLAKAIARFMSKEKISHLKY